MPLKYLLLTISFAFNKPLIYNLYLVYHVRIINIPFDIPLGSKFMDPGKFAKFASCLGFKIQDSGKKNLESKTRPGFKKFPPESWILNLGKFAKFAFFLGFKILGKTSWIQDQAWIQEVSPRILNPGKFAKFAIFGKCICLCICIRVYLNILYISLIIHIYIWSPLSINRSIIIPNHKISKR